MDAEFKPMSTVAASITESSRVTRERVNKDDVVDLLLYEDARYSEQESFAFLGSRESQGICNSGLAEWAGRLRSHIGNAHANELEFRATYEGDQFRVRRLRTVAGPAMALRRLPKDVPSLDAIRIHPIWRRCLMDPLLLQGGLIVLASVTGQGKSTTIGTTIRSRLEHFGGYCLTIEDPAEMPLHGQFGRGRCVQTEVDPTDPLGYGGALKGALRCFPTLTDGGSMLLVGEVRDPQTAADMLRAAVNGHLVLTTVHANEIQTAMSRLCAFATESLGDVAARDLLASALRICIHQTLRLDRAASGWQRGVIGGEIMVSDGRVAPAVPAIREGNFKALAQVIDRQEKLMRNRTLTWEQMHEQLYCG